LSEPALDPVFLNQNKAYSSYEIGDWTYGKPRVMSWDARTKLVIGKFCSIADDVTILLGGEHRTDWVTTYPFNVLFDDASSFLGHPHTKGDVVIENDVWIGQGSLILSGVTIGNGSAIAAKSVVTKDVSPYSIVGGNPARLIKYRFSDSTIEQLQQIAWWNWPISRIQEAWPLLLSDAVDEFVEKYRNVI
jgi:acetyltransferase-like isoleucine patch superfamily enzyme